MSVQSVDDETVIRRMIENWAIWRDLGDWDRLAGLWHPRGRMIATWFSGSAAEFIDRSRAALGKQVMAHHELGGTSVRIAEGRAVAQTRMTLHLRTFVHGVLCDVMCLGRFVDFLVRERGNWTLLLRQPVYEKDRLDSVEPSAQITMDRDLLASFPAGYRHLAYAQAQAGMQVRTDLPGADGVALDRLRWAVAAWLDNAASPDDIQ